MLSAQREKYSDDKNRLREKRLKSKEKQEVLIDTAHIIMKYTKFLTLEDTDEIFYYSTIWNKEGKTVIKKVCHDLNDLFTVHDINEITDKIRRLTYEKREILDPPHLIGFENCVLDMNTWEIIPHKKEHYLTKIIPVNYEPGVFPDKFERFFDVIQEKDRNLVLELMGHCLMNDYRFQKAFVLTGEGANGKSTLLNVLSDILGRKNITAYTLQNFEKNQFAASKLFGKMANISPDISSKSLYNTQVFKILTGGDYGDHNIKGKESITFRNTAKLIFSCNTLPAIYEDTHAIWRRLCIINFVKVIPVKDQDEKLLMKLTTKEELSGILNILLFSLKRLMDRGRFEGLKSILDTREQYIMKSDIIHAFCDNCLEYEDTAYEESDDLFREQCLYAEAIGVSPKTKQSLTKQLLLWKPKAYSATIMKGKKKVRVWRGIKINKWRSEIEN